MHVTSPEHRAIAVHSVHTGAPIHPPSVPHVRVVEPLERKYPPSQLITQASAPYSVLPLHVAVRVESVLSLEYATATVAPQSGRRQTGMAPVHVPSGLHTLVAKASVATVPSKCNRKLRVRLRISNQNEFQSDSDCRPIKMKNQNQNESNRNWPDRKFCMHAEILTVETDC